MSSPAPVDSMRRAFAARLHEIVDQLSVEADEATIAETLATAGPIASMAKALGGVVAQHGLRYEDPLAPARLRGVTAREELIRKAGGLIRLHEAAERLGVTSQAVSGRRSRNTIMAVPLPNGEWVYPAFQFTDQGILPGLDRVLAAFREISPWTQLSVILSASERYGGRSAFELLLAGDVDAARSIAATFGEQG